MRSGLYILTWCLISLNHIYGQVQVTRIESFPDYIESEITNRDTIYNLRQFIDKSNSNSVIDFDILIIRKDSSKSKQFYIETGKLIRNRKFGIWDIQTGSYQNDKRLPGSFFQRYFFDDYEIIKDESITRKIEIDTINLTAICDFLYFSGHKDKFNMRICYWMDDKSKTAKACCKMLSGKIIFETTADNVSDECILMFTGAYDRIIYAR